jgi:AmpD protein
VNVIDMPLAHGGNRINRPLKIIVHAMGEYIEQGGRDCTAYELLNRLGLSAHALVTPTGEVIRCRDDDEQAYHAKGANRNSLGVEFLVPGLHTYATFVEAIQTEYLSSAQYAAGLMLVRQWVADHGLQRDKIVRHSDVSPGRKHDPGTGFPWTEFLDDVYVTGGS